MGDNQVSESAARNRSVPRGWPPRLRLCARPGRRAHARRRGRPTGARFALLIDLITFIADASALFAGTEARFRTRRCQLRVHQAQSRRKREYTRQP